MTLDEIYTKTRNCLKKGPIIIENFKIINILHHKDMLFVTGFLFGEFSTGPIYSEKIEQGFFISDKYSHKRKEQLINYLLKLENIWND